VVGPDASIGTSDVARPEQHDPHIRVITGPGGSGILHSSLARATMPLNVLQLGSPQASSLAPDVVSAFLRIQHDLGVTQDDMFAATGIKHRTFHSWKRKSSSSRPRLDSVGRLWYLDELVDELRETLDVPLDRWIKSSSEHLALFRNGDLYGLLDRASAVGSERDLDTAVEYTTGVGVDVVVPIVRSGKRHMTSVQFRSDK
jgi:hypothetical protein